jgi:hypothetical protein
MSALWQSGDMSPHSKTSDRKNERKPTMIAQLLTELQAAEKTGVAVVGAAEAAYNASVKSHDSVGQTAALDPGRHQVALGAIRTAIEHVETIVGAAADAQEAAATKG